MESPFPCIPPGDLGGSHSSRTVTWTTGGLRAISVLNLHPRGLVKKRIGTRSPRLPTSGGWLATSLEREGTRGGDRESGGRGVLGLGPEKGRESRLCTGADRL